ncbi:hypothetical protein ABPG72_020753 [Tetrahymena utriculariae]
MISLVSGISKVLRIKENYNWFKTNIKNSQSFRIKSGLVLAGAGGFGYYIRQKYYLKVKGIDKLEIILTEDEFQRRDQDSSRLQRYIDIHNDDQTKPLAILSPKRPERVKQILKQIAKSNLGILCTDSINDFNTQIDPENDLKIKNHFVVLNPKNMKQFKLLEDQKIVRIGVGWRIHELNSELMKKGFYIPLDPKHNNQTIFDLINQDEGKLLHPIHKFFKQIVGDMLVFLPNGEAQIGTHNVGPGINLKELFFGSNANIGIATEVDVRVFRLPKNFHKLIIHLNQYTSWTQINYLIKNLYDAKQNRYLSELEVTPSEKRLVICMDKAYPTENEKLINKWKKHLLKGNFLDKWVISDIEVQNEFPKELFSQLPKKSPFNIELSFKVTNKNFPKDMSKFLSYLNDNYNQYSEFQLTFDLNSKMINLSLNYNENSEDLLRHKDFLMNQSLLPAYIPDKDDPLISPTLQKYSIFKYIQNYWNPQKQDLGLQKLVKQHPISASPLIQEDPRKSFAKKLINHVINDYGQLIYCSNLEIKNFFKKQDLFLNYGLHGSRLQLELYKFFDRANILYNPIFCQKEIFPKKYITYK